MQTFTIHDVTKVTLDPIRHINDSNPFFYRYLEVQDVSGNILQLCLYSTWAAAIEINEPKEETT